MNAQTIELFTLALGLRSPWTCTKVEFSAEIGKLDLWVDFERGSRFACPTCETAACPVYDSTEKQWRHLNFFQHECYLHARVPRVRCETCGVHQVAVPWARPGSGFTLLFEAMVMAMAKSNNGTISARSMSTESHVAAKTVAASNSKCPARAPRLASSRRSRRHAWTAS